MGKFLNVLQSIASPISSAVGGLFNYLGQKKQIQAAQQQQAEQNAFNLAQYEDWKHYNSLDERLKRAKDAGISPFAALGVNDTLPSAYQQNNSIIPNDGGFGAIGSTLSAVGKSVQNTYLDKQERKFDREFRAETLRIQRAQLDAMKQWRKEVLDNQKWQFGLKQAYNMDMLQLQRENLAFKKDFYSDANYLGYWNVQNAKQSYEFNDKANPIRIAMLNNQKSMSDVDALNYKDWIDYRNSSAMYRANELSRMDRMNSTLYDLELAAKSAQLNAIKNDPNNTSVGRWINYGLGVANQLGNTIGNWKNNIVFPKPKSPLWIR